jgi:hypothetical protein
MSVVKDSAGFITQRGTRKLDFMNLQTAKFSAGSVDCIIVEVFSISYPKRATRKGKITGIRIK